MRCTFIGKFSRVTRIKWYFIWRQYTYVMIETRINEYTLIGLFGVMRTDDEAR